MVYSNSYSLNVDKLKNLIDLSKKTKKQLANDVSTTSRTLTRALNGEKIQLITIQRLAVIFKTQIQNLISDENFDENNPGVIFNKITDVRETLSELSKKHGDYFSPEKFMDHIYFHYDLRFNETVRKEIDPLLEIFRTDIMSISKTYDEKNKSRDYVLRHSKIIELLSKGNSHIDNLSKYINVYYANYYFSSINTAPYHDYIADEDGNPQAHKDNYHYFPFRKEITLIVFSEKKSDKIILYPDIGLSLPKLEKKYFELINNEERGAHKKYCSQYFNYWKNFDYCEDFHGLNIHLEQQELFPNVLNQYGPDKDNELYHLDIPMLNNNYRYKGDIIILDDKSEKKKEADM